MSRHLFFYRRDFNNISVFFQRFRLDDVENQGNYLVLGQVSPEDQGVSAILMSQRVDLELQIKVFRQNDFLLH